jgi:hypothetical protein
MVIIPKIIVRPEAKLKIPQAPEIPEENNPPSILVGRLLIP